MHHIIKHDSPHTCVCNGTAYHDMVMHFCLQSLPILVEWDLVEGAHGGGVAVGGVHPKVVGTGIGSVELLAATGFDPAASSLPETSSSGMSRQMLKCDLLSQDSTR